MDYKNILYSQLLSQTNINFLVNTILSNFKISNKAINKCVNIITNNLVKYLENIDRYPENNDELIEAINFLNKKCFEDFTTYLSTKYPNINLLRSAYNSSEQINHDIIDNSKNKLQEQLKKPEQNYRWQHGQTTMENVSIQPYEEMEIITEEEKNNLIKLYEKSQNKEKTQFPMDDVLSYLTNPVVLQMFNIMINQMNQQTPILPKSINEETKTQIIDDILDIHQVQILLAKTMEHNNNHNIPITTKTKEEKLIESNDSNKEDKDDSFNNSNKFEDNDINYSTKQETNQQIDINKDDTKSDEIHKSDNYDKYSINLSNLSNEQLLLAGKKINELTSLRNKYLSENNKQKIKEIDEEREKIINAIKTHKKQLEKQAKENENIIKGITMSRTKRPEDGDNIEYLDLKFDPTNDFNDLKNITIGFKTEKKISDITLIDYFIPFNSNNITRFNNKFVVYFNDKINRFIIPPGKYEINVLLEYIKNQANFLDFTINDNKIITIKNTMNMKFDLMVDKDTIFPLLGFIGKPENYKDKLFYSGSQPYNVNCNEKILFFLSGSTMEPLVMEFNKQITLNQSIKKSRAGVAMKQMILNFTDALGQYYDFIMPFKMCFKITYQQ